MPAAAAVSQGRYAAHSAHLVANMLATVLLIAPSKLQYMAAASISSFSVVCFFRCVLFNQPLAISLPLATLGLLVLCTWLQV